MGEEHSYYRFPVHTCLVSTAVVVGDKAAALIKLLLPLIGSKSWQFSNNHDSWDESSQAIAYITLSLAITGRWSETPAGGVAT